MVCIDYDSNGNKQSEFNYADDKLHGVGRYWYDDGQLQPRSYGGWNVWRDDHTPYNARGRRNASPRMIRADDDRHAGQTTVVFLDGHTETRKLADGITDNGVPLRLFNPYAEINYPRLRGGRFVMLQKRGCKPTGLVPSIR